MDTNLLKYNQSYLADVNVVILKPVFLMFRGSLPGFSSAASIKPGWKSPFTTTQASYLPPFTTTQANYLPKNPVFKTNVSDRTANGTAHGVVVGNTNTTCHQDLGATNILHSFQDMSQWINPATVLFLLAFLIQN